jgi:hypothetical protein
MKVIISLKVGSNASSVVYSDVAALGSAEDTWGEWIVLTSKAKQVPIISQRAIIFRVFGLKTSNLQYRSYSLSIRGCAQIGGGMGCSSYIEEHTLPVELSKSIAVDP